MIWKDTSSGSLLCSTPQQGENTLMEKEDTKLLDDLLKKLCLQKSFKEEEKLIPAAATVNVAPHDPWQATGDVILSSSNPIHKTHSKETVAVHSRSNKKHEYVSMYYLCCGQPEVCLLVSWFNITKTIFFHYRGHHTALQHHCTIILVI